MDVAHCDDETQMRRTIWIRSDILIDLEQSGEWGFVKELISIFLEDCAARIASMRNAASARDLTALAFCSHTLKGSAKTMNALPLAEFSAEIERYAKLNQQRDYLSLIDRLDLALAEVRQAMTSYGQSLP